MLDCIRDPVAGAGTEACPSHARPLSANSLCCNTPGHRQPKRLQSLEKATRARSTHSLHQQSTHMCREEFWPLLSLSALQLLGPSEK